MRSALKRDLDENVFPRPADEGGASAEGQENLPKAMRAYARPRIVETKARGADASVPEDIAEAVQPPAEPVDALMSDLQRIMASLDAQRRSDVPSAESVPVASPKPVAPALGDAAQPLGTVAAAALRAFRDAETNARSNTSSGAGARLLAEEAARIAAERRGASPPVSREAAMDRPADEMLLAAPPSDEPYVYGAGETAAPVAAPEISPLAEPVRDEAYVAQDFVPARHRPVETAHAAVPAATATGEGFAFDINAFVDELEREAESAGREWSGEDGEAMFAGGRTELDARETLPPPAPPAEASIPAVAAAPAVDTALARALTVDEKAPQPSLATLSLESWEPEAREPAAPTIAPPPVRHVRTDSFTWKRFALLGLFVVGAIGAGVALQSVAARNDSGGGEAAGSAAVASVAPSGDTADLRGTSDAATPAQPAVAVRTVTPKVADQVAQDDSAPAATGSVAPSVELAATAQPANQAMDPALSADGLDASSVATPESAAPGAELADASNGEAQAPETAAPEVSADEIQASDAQSADAPAPRQPVAVVSAKPQSAAKPAVAAAKPVLAAAAPAARLPVAAVSNAPPKGSATIKSGVTLRGGPDNKAASLGTLKTGQKVDLVSCKVWCEIVADGKRGFVFKKFVEAGAPAQ
ncbi:hypothetical protein G3545_00440 [Starkeya sp. ORNL1]|uniref:SH3 domain-containing protein n=1 Tax=Starkeya sp. ORNL1 TaxID=2709380 RepID=UPI001462C113|nr:SH3 domain-containing protein [Starkeya sp. ORNL1]QJP12259.1 hypothetical protein G3545_00440 [Starkeya sp. ORNL1]